MNITTANKIKAKIIGTYILMPVFGNSFGFSSTFSWVGSSTGVSGVVSSGVVSSGVSDGSSGVGVISSCSFAVNLNVSSEKQAQQICDNWKNNASYMYAEIIDLLIKENH